MSVETMTAQPAVGRARYKVVAWLVAGGIINYIDRSTLSIAAPEMVKDLGLTMTQIGLMGTVFSWCYALAQIPTGWLSDRVNARIVFAVGLILWSFATMATGLFTGLWLILFCRALLGICEAPCWPVATKIISFWFPRQERGVAIGLFTSSAKWGPAIAPPILVAVMMYFGWRGVFLVSGGAGILVGILFYLFYRNPDKSKTISREELDHIRAGGGGTEHTMSSDKGKNSISWGSLFAYRSVWGLIIGYFCAIWIWNTFIVFMPSYLLHTYDISLAKMGFYASIPWLGGAAGSMSSGFVAKWVAGRFGLTPLKANQRLVASYAMLAACSSGSTKQHDHKFTGRIGLAYLFDNGLAPYVSYSTSFAPTTGASRTVQFKPTEGEQMEVGIRYAPEGSNLLVSAALFDITQSNMLVNMDSVTQAQTGEVSSRGFEIQATSSITDALSLTAAYTYLDMKYHEGASKGNFPAGIPDQTFSIWAQYNVLSGPLEGLGAGLGARFLDTSHADDGNTRSNPSRTLVDASLSYDFGKLRPNLGGLTAQVSAKNVFDDREVTCVNLNCYREEGRSVIGSLKFRF